MEKIMGVSTATKKVQLDMLDEVVNVIQRIARSSTPHEQKKSDMTVRVDAGQLFYSSGPPLTKIATQSTSIIVKPTTPLRVDRIVIEDSTGVVFIFAGAETANLTPPTITTRKLSITQAYPTINTT